MEQRNNRFKRRNKETKKEYNRRWLLRDKIRKKEETEWKQLQSALRSSAIKEIMNDTAINYIRS